MIKSGILIKGDIMIYVYLIIVLLFLYVIEFLLYSKDKKFVLVSFLRYLMVNFVYFICLVFIPNVYVMIVITFIKLIIDKVFVFKKLEVKITNWEKYYNKKPLKIVSKKRENNINYILNVLNENKFDGKNFLEYGGGNSHVAGVLSSNYDVSKFTIVDNNEVGIRLLDEKNIKNLDKKCMNLFDFEDKKNYDLCYSIGVIEHFQGKSLEDVIKEHFKYVKKGGYVLITFPAPTLKYKFIRLVYEVFDKWLYTDEVPLVNEKVEKMVKREGKLLHSSVNTSLILPQGIVLVLKERK